ncbi:hypothetical protein [Pyrococcus kukulkanii]|uniref:Uncharacterized protein n=1 Tax=Pyrococcus kukulkanii TaxID=1609559 RepID=A0ABV4T780_9EURY
MRLIYEEFSQTLYYGMRGDFTYYYILDTDHSLFVVLEVSDIEGDITCSAIATKLRKEDAEKLYELAKNLPRSILVDFDIAINLRDPDVILEVIDTWEEDEKELRELYNYIKDVKGEETTIIPVFPSPALDLLPLGNDILAIDITNLFLYNLKSGDLGENKSEIQKILGREVNKVEEVIELLRCCDVQD